MLWCRNPHVSSWPYKWNVHISWPYKLRTTSILWGFQNSRFDTSFFIFNSNDNIIYLLVYINDILLIRNKKLLNKLISDLNKELALKNLGQIYYFLGIEVHQDTIGLYFTQSKYVTDLLKKDNMENIKPCRTSMTVGKNHQVIAKRKKKDEKSYSLQKCDWCPIIANLDQARHFIQYE